MIRLPDLNDQSYEDILENAINQIKTYGDSWTDLDVHDPGVTFLELLTYLKTIQQDSINTITAQSLYKFLPMLDIKPLEAVGAKAFVSFSCKEDIYIPRGTKFYAGDIVFENKQRIFVHNNNIKAMGQFNKHNSLMQEYVLHSMDRKINIFHKNNVEDNSFYILFENPIPENNIVNFYFELEKEPNKKRNPVTNPESFLPLSKVVWEYYGEEDSVLGWHDIDINEDETWGFLFSGRIDMLLKGVHAKNGIDNIEGYAIRARLVENGYENLPVLSGIEINSIVLHQQDTKCETIEFTYEQFMDNKMFFESFIFEEGYSLLFIKDEDGYTMSQDADIVYMIREEDGFYRLGTSDREKIHSMFNKKSSILKKDVLDENTVVLKLVVYTREIFPFKVMGSSKGYAEQIMSLNESKFGNIIFEEFSLMVKNKEGKNLYWNKWQQKHNIDKYKEKDKVFILNDTTATIQFGNNIIGKVPTRGEDNILVTDLKTLVNERGNVQKGIIQINEDSYLFEKVKIKQFKDAVGGRKKESVSQLQSRVMAEINTNIKRAVTMEDYEYFAKNTQGIIADSVTVIPLYKPFLEDYPQNTAENSVTVVVESLTAKNSGSKLDNYIENIRRNLEKTKLITTQVYVMTPQYMAIDIYGDIVVEFGYPNIEVDIKNAFNEYIDELQQEGLGISLYHGDMYNILENIREIIQVKYLKMELVGKKVAHNAFGNIKIPPYGRAYIRDFYIQIDYK